MAWVKAILGVLAAFPKILDLVDQAIKALSQVIDDIKRDAALKDEGKAADVAKQTKNTSDLEHLFDPTRPKPNPPPADQL